MAPKSPQITIVARLERLIDSEEDEIKLERDPSRRKARVNTLAMLLGELRKAEKDARNASSDIDRPRVVEWFRTMSDTEQSRFIRELEMQRKKGSGLA